MQKRTKYSDRTVDGLCEKLADGQSLRSICAERGMPGRSTVWAWLDGDDALGVRLRQSREVGWYLRAERAVEIAQTAKDPLAGRLAFDAERWFLGKVSRHFADKSISIGAVINVGASDTFAAIAAALDRASGTIALSGTATQRVALPSPSRPVDPAGD